MLFFHEELTRFITAPANYLFGSSLVVLGAVTWAIYALAQKQLLQSLSLAKIMLIIYGACAFLFSFFATPKTIFTLNKFDWGMTIFRALNTIIAYGAFAESLEHWEASQVTTVLAIAIIVTLISVDIVSVIAPTLIAPEHLTTIVIAGAIMVVTGSIAIALGK